MQHTTKKELTLKLKWSKNGIYKNLLQHLMNVVKRHPEVLCCIYVINDALVFDLVIRIYKINGLTTDLP